MEFLQYNAEESDSDFDPKQEKNESVQCKWIEDGKSDTDEEKDTAIDQTVESNHTDKSVESTTEAAKSSLPSADQLFKIVNDTPKFLKQQNVPEFQVQPTVKHSYTELSTDFNKVKESEKASFPVKLVPETGVKKKAISMEQFRKLKSSLQPSPNPELHKEPVNDRLTAKDRVKRQRLSGQSGIGSDFKHWKSEEEMRQRQQFD